MRKLALCAGVVAALALAGCGDMQQQSSPPAGVAATINGSAISMQRYDAAVQTVRGRLEQRIGHGINVTIRSGARQLAEVEATALRALIAQSVVDQLAAAHHVTVSAGDVDTALQHLGSAAGNADDLVAALGSTGLSDSDAHAAIRMLLLQQRLRAADPAGYDSAFATALRDARVLVYAAPCAGNHAYPACLQAV